MSDDAPPSIVDTLASTSTTREQDGSYDNPWFHFIDKDAPERNSRRVLVKHLATLKVNKTPKVQHIAPCWELSVDVHPMDLPFISCTKCDRFPEYKERCIMFVERSRSAAHIDGKHLPITESYEYLHLQKELNSKENSKRFDTHHCFVFPKGVALNNHGFSVYGDELHKETHKIVWPFKNIKEKYPDTNMTGDAVSYLVVFRIAQAGGTDVNLSSKAAGLFSFTG